MGVFPTIITTYASLDNVRNLVRMAQSFVPAWRIVMMLWVTAPIVAGMRITVSYSLMLLIAAEMIGADAGLGAMILQAGNVLRSDQILAGVTILSVIGLCCSALLTGVEKMLFKWR